MPDEGATRPLDGLRVLDLTRLLPGPFATLLLADLGARIIKIEAPRIGDYARHMPPLGGRMSAVFAALNRDKESVGLDLKQPEGRAAFERLVAQADVVVDSFRPGVMARLGLDPARLEAINPRVITCSITGYGHTGPLARKAGHDLNYVAVAGLAGITGADGAPVTPGLQMADIAGGALYAVIGVLAALHARHRTGRGRFVDASMTDGVAGLGLMLHAKQHLDGQPVPPGFDLLAGDRPCYRIWPCKDGALAVGALEPKFWMGLCAAIGRPDLATDGLATGRHKAKVEAELTALFASRTRDEWVAFFAEHDVCVEPVLSLEEARRSPHAEARGLYGAHHHPVEGVEFFHQYPNPGLLPGLEPPKTPRPAPRLGEQTRDVLIESGLDPEAVDRLIAAGAAAIP